MTVYLCCEFPARDLDARLLIASHLLRFGIPVVVGQLWGIVENLPLQEPGVVLFSTANKWQGQYMETAKSARHIVAMTDEEALAIRDEALLAATVSAKAVECGEFFFVQSKPHETAVLRAFPSARTRLVGSARIDLLRERRFFADEIKNNQQRGPYVLVNTNFTALNGLWADVHHETWEIDMQKTNFATLKQVLQWLVGTAKMRIILRPHPAENADIWHDMGPIEIVRGATAIPWIGGAALTIHPGSTTGFEAAVMGAPSINVGVPDPRYVIDEANFQEPSAPKATEAIAQFLSERRGPIASYKPRLPFFPADGALKIARALQTMHRSLTNSVLPSRWDQLVRREVSAKKFTVPPDQFARRARTFCGAAEIRQLDDSLFMMLPSYMQKMPRPGR